MSYKGKTNAYRCGTCGGMIVTVDRDAGVTPFGIACRATPGCGGQMLSAFYRVEQTLVPGWEWVLEHEDQPMRLRKLVN